MGYLLHDFELLEAIQRTPALCPPQRSQMGRGRRENELTVAVCDCMQVLNTKLVKILYCTYIKGNIT